MLEELGGLKILLPYLGIGVETAGREKMSVGQGVSKGVRVRDPEMEFYTSTAARWYWRSDKIILSRLNNFADWVTVKGFKLTYSNSIRS